MSNDFYSNNSQKNARLNGTYDQIMGSLTKCPFCDLKSKYFVKALSACVLTTNLFPYADGHLLIIPKRHVQQFKDLNVVEWSEINELIKFGMSQLTDVLGVKSFNVLYREGVSSGSSLGHLHFHILPMDEPVIIPKYLEVKLSPVDLAERLRD